MDKDSLFIWLIKIYFHSEDSKYAEAIIELAQSGDIFIHIWCSCKTCIINIKWMTIYWSYVGRYIIIYNIYKRVILSFEFVKLNKRAIYFCQDWSYWAPNQWYKIKRRLIFGRNLFTSYIEYEYITSWNYSMTYINNARESLDFILDN